MLEYIKNLFKKNKTQNLELKNLSIGSFVEVEYKHPSKIGIINCDHLTCTRLNKDEVENRKIQGFIYSKYFDNELRKWFLGIRSCKKNGNEIIERDFLFLEYEIDKLRILN